MGSFIIGSLPKGFNGIFNGINHNRKSGAFEIERPKVGLKGESSGCERVKGHREHRE
jgi:hypothetical protein